MGQLTQARNPVLTPAQDLDGLQHELVIEDVDVTTQTEFVGLTTFANLPYTNCLHEGKGVAAYDIAILGAPFDTVGHHICNIVPHCSGTLVSCVAVNLYFGRPRYTSTDSYCQGWLHAVIWHRLRRVTL